MVDLDTWHFFVAHLLQECGCIVLNKKCHLPSLPASYPVLSSTTNRPRYASHANSQLPKYCHNIQTQSHVKLLGSWCRSAASFRCCCRDLLLSAASWLASFTPLAISWFRCYHQYRTITNEKRREDTSAARAAAVLGSIPCPSSPPVLPSVRPSALTFGLFVRETDEGCWNGRLVVVWGSSSIADCEPQQLPIVVTLAFQYMWYSFVVLMKWVSDTWPIQGEAEHGCQAGNKARDYFTFSAACKKWLFGVGWATIAVYHQQTQVSLLPSRHRCQTLIFVSCWP